MAKYDDLAIYDARVVITGIIDRLNLGFSVAERLVPNYAASEQGRLHRSTLDLWNDLFEVVDKWEARQHGFASPREWDGFSDARADSYLDGWDKL